MLFKPCQMPLKTLLIFDTISIWPNFFNKKYKKKQKAMREKREIKILEKEMLPALS